MEDGLSAPVRDPLWMLSRQWQVGELRGEDAGSPVRADVTVAEDELSRVDLRGGPQGESAGPNPIDYDGGPLEATVEREPVMGEDEGPPLALRAEAGQQFLRTLADAGYGTHSAEDFAESLHLEEPEEALEASDRRYVDLMAGRALDGTEVARAIRESVGNIDDVVSGETGSWSSVSSGSLPVPAGGSRTGTFDDCVESFYGWYVSLYDEPTTETGSAWDPTRLEYRFAASTGEGDTETVFEAPEYDGGRLDWHAFSPADAAESLESSQLATSGGVELPETTFPLEHPNAPEDSPTIDYPEDHATTLRQKTVLPTQVSFPGMPANRWWEFEDGDVDLAQATDDGASLSRLLLTEFATQYGNDWFQIPIDTPIGTLSRIVDLTVTDSFGVTETASAAMEEDWQLYMHDLPGQTEPGLFVPPTLSDSVTGDPVEKVVFTRDEIANLVFAIERIVESPTGQALDRTEFTPPSLEIDRVSAAEDPDEEYVELANPGDDELEVETLTVSAASDGSRTAIHTFGQRTLGPGETMQLYTGSPAQPSDVGAGESASVWESAEAVTITNSDDRVVTKKLLAGPSDALADYRLATDVPDYWFPFTPEQGWTATLERALLLDASTLGLPVESLPRPRGEILRPEADLLPADQDTYQIHDEEVTRSGREVTRQYQFARWVDGASHLWCSRESRVADTQLASGLAFDILEEQATE